MNKLMTFEGNNVEIITDAEGNPLFELYSVGMALGYARSNGKTVGEQGVHKLFPYKSRIDKVVENAEIEPCAHGVNKYLTEEMIYDFMLEAKTEKCKSFRKWITHEVLPTIRKTGGYIPVKENESDSDIMAKALLIAQRTLDNKNKELEEKTKLINQIESANNSILVRDVAKIASKNGIIIGERKLYQKLRDWKLLMKGNIPYQEYIDRGYFEIIERAVETSNNTLLSKTTMVTGKGQTYIIKRLLKENK